MMDSHSFHHSIIFALFSLFFGSTGVSNYIKPCLTTKRPFWSDFSARKVTMSVEKPVFATWLGPISHYGFFMAYSTNNRADSSHWQIWCIATIKSSVQVGILTPGQKLKRCKHPCLYYSNSFASFHCMLEGDLVFKLNPEPINNGGQSTTQTCCSR